MQAGLLGCMTTPAQGNVIPPGALYACDNGKFGRGWPGTERWFAWLRSTVDRYGPDRCLWAVAPDVPLDAAATLAESMPWLARIRILGVSVAFAAQDGSEHGLIPWGSFDVLFLMRQHGLEDRPGRPPPRREGPRARPGRPHGPRQLPSAAAPRAGLRLQHLRRHLPRLRSRHQPPRLLAWMNELHATPTPFGDTP